MRVQSVRGVEEEGSLGRLVSVRVEVGGVLGRAFLPRSRARARARVRVRVRLRECG